MLKIQKGHVAEFYYPQFDNDEKPLAKEQRDFTKAILEFSQGYTDKGLVHGVWRGAWNEYFKDELVVYEVAELTMFQVSKLAYKIKEDARQYVVYLKVDGLAYTY